MTYAIAAAGTGGHVFPGLSVGEALVRRGVPHDNIVYVGGSRLESKVYPAEGFPFLQVELRGLKRSFSASNLGIPRVVSRAVSAIAGELRTRDVRVMLGMGGYVTIPAALAARRVRARLVVSEQNAEAGLANALASRWADVAFGAFPSTTRMAKARWVGNPVRPWLSVFDRSALRSRAIEHYGLDATVPVLGVFGGSLGAGVINRAVTDLATSWSGPDLQILHLAGEEHAAALRSAADGAGVPWTVIAFEPAMDLFYAASDLVVARAGGAVAELAITRTPSILIPGGFGSGRHQDENARAFEEVGGAVVLSEKEVGNLSVMVSELVGDPERRGSMARCLAALARTDAADVIAATMEELHG